ncbi:hypothetical protein AVE30378_02514 [Achromobacter veterisilvae]|uniref:Uncharacterized protein n=1 Tax=Achromobacter veterisilvae TaxID=2069367 RepID=A0A446CH28_9BURK|nr:hypothetical protein [Achromobacter veterisilvae]SSW67227.1 hypothetical protein AVE30378_02514 [Achromobacter veterisilvae]
MRTDRELLELAARANWAQEVADDEISLRYCEINDGILYLHADNQDHNGHDREFVWNPLTDDGDNRRLQVKLGLGLVPLEGGGWGCITWDHGEEVTLATDFDPNRAIVRGAAEIGAQAHSDHKDGGANA